MVSLTMQELLTPCCLSFLTIRGVHEANIVCITYIPDNPPGFRIVAIDYPGHGLSSHIPKGESNL